MLEKIILKIEQYNIYFLLILSFSLYSSITEGTVINSIFIWPIVFLSIICILYRIVNFSKYNINNMIKYLLLFSLSYLISMLINFKGELYQSFRTFVLMFIVFFYVFLKKKNQLKNDNINVKGFCNIFMLLSTISAFFSLCIFNISQLFVSFLGETKYITGLRWGRLEGLFTDVNYGATICVISICMAIYMFFSLKKTCHKIKFLYIIVIIINYCYITLSDSRMALIALTIISILTFINMSKSTIYKICGICIAISLIVGARFLIKGCFNLIYDHLDEQVYINGLDFKVIYPEIKENSSIDNYNNTIKKDNNIPNLNETVETTNLTKAMNTVTTRSLETKKEKINNESIESKEGSKIKSENKIVSTINDNNIYDRRYSSKTDISNRRFDLWKSSIEIFKTRPIFGVSFENIEKYATENLPNTYLIKNDYKKFDNFHNIFFNILAGQGILGIIIFILVFVYLFITVYVIGFNKIKQSNQKENRIFTQNIITIGLIESIFIGDLIFYISPVAIAWWFFLGFFVDWIEKDKIENKKYGKIYRIFPKIYRNFFIVLFNLFPINSKKIFLSSYSGKGYGDNAKYIVEEINRINLDCVLIWGISDENNKRGLPPNVKAVMNNSIEYFYHICTAKIWIDNHRKIIDLKKRRKQFYIQTWHGGIALKKIEKDAEHKLEKKYVKQAIHDSQMADLFISNSTFCSNMYKNAFWYNGEVKEFGTPRNDILINYPNENSKREEILKKIGIEKQVKILLYAPTFRKDENIQYYDIDINRVLKILDKKTKEKWICLIRLHPIIAKKGKDLVFTSDKVTDVSLYDDMYELMLISDIMITDYSSVMFEFSYMKKPVFLYASDVDRYIDERGFYFDYFNLPYPVSQNNNELEELINKFDYELYNKKLNKFFKEIGLKEHGDAAKKVVEVIKYKIEEG